MENSNDNSGIKVFFSREDDEYVAVHEDYPSLSWISPKKEDAREGLIQFLRNLEEE